MDKQNIKDKSTRIAPLLNDKNETVADQDGNTIHWTAKCWKKLLSEKGKISEDEWWKTATKILNDRIYGRFLRVCDEILRQTSPKDCSPKFEGAGFAVIALDCLLIETLQQFWDGKKDTDTPNLNAFVNFFKNFEFKNGFDNGHIGGLFYTQIRCGLLHQSETKNRSKIISKGEESPILDNTPQGESKNKDLKYLEINRDAFHRRLKEVFEWYLKGLRGEHKDEWNWEDLEDRRCNFRRKMNFICESLEIEYP